MCNNLGYFIYLLIHNQPEFGAEAILAGCLSKVIASSFRAETVFYLHNKIPVILGYAGNCKGCNKPERYKSIQIAYGKSWGKEKNGLTVAN